MTSKITNGKRACLPGPNGFYRPPAWASTSNRKVGGDQALRQSWCRPDDGRSKTCWAGWQWPATPADEGFADASRVWGDVPLVKLFGCYNAVTDPNGCLCDGHLRFYGYAPMLMRCALCLMPFGDMYEPGRWTEQSEGDPGLCVVCELRERTGSLGAAVEAAALYNAPTMRTVARIELILMRRGQRTRADVIRRVADGAWGNRWMFGLLKFRIVTVRQAGMIVVAIAKRIVSEREARYSATADRLSGSSRKVAA